MRHGCCRVWEITGNSPYQLCGTSLKGKTVAKRTTRTAGGQSLAINGGSPVRATAWPARGLLGMAEKKAVMALFDQAISSGQPIAYNGHQEEAFCRQFADMLGGGYADGVNSGTTAVYVALRALELEPLSEVVVGPVTDPGGIMPIPLLNCIPIVADAAPGSFNTGPEQIEARITPRTRAIIVPHILGEPADMPAIMRVARRHKIPVVEDCAQAHGATIRGRPVGTFGTVTAFSTMFGKHFCTGGQGGIVYTRNRAVYQRTRRLADRGKPFFLPAGSSNVVAALNLNMDELGAAIGRVQLRKLPGIVARRRRLVDWIRHGISALKTVALPAGIPGASPSYWFLRLRFQPDGLSVDKQAYCKALAAEGLQVIPNYAALPFKQSWFRQQRAFGKSNWPWSAVTSQTAGTDFTYPNVEQSISEHFLLPLSESWGRREAADITAIFRKVEAVKHV